MSEYKNINEENDFNNKLLDDNFESILLKNNNIDNYDKSIFDKYNILENEENLFNSSNSINQKINIENFSNSSKCPIVKNDKILFYDKNDNILNKDIDNEFVWNNDKTPSYIHSNNSDKTIKYGNNVDIFMKTSESSVKGHILYSNTNQENFNNNYKNVSNSSNLKLTNEFTVMIWVYQNSRNSSWIRILGKGNSTYRNYGLWIRNDGVTLSQIYGINNSGRNAYPGPKVPLNTWTHIACTFKKNGKHKLYFNGSLSKSVNVSGTPYTSNDPLTMGGATFHTKLKGSLTHAYVINKELNSNQIKEFYYSYLYNHFYSLNTMKILPGPNNTSTTNDIVFYKDNIILEGSNKIYECIPKRPSGQQCSIKYPHFNEDGNYQIQKIKVRCDDNFEMYVNGKTYKGAGWNQTFTFTDVPVASPQGFVIVFKCFNGVGPGGLIAEIELTNGSYFVTNNSWKATDQIISLPFLKKYTDTYTLNNWTTPNVFQTNKQNGIYNVDNNFSEYANWIWYGNNYARNKTVYLAIKIGNPPAGQQCNANLTNSQALCYMDRYADLRNSLANISSKNEKIEWLKNHWKNYGCREGRTYDCVKPPLTVGNFEYQGCYNNDVNNNVIEKSWGKKETLEQCREKAEKNRQTVFGMTDDGECYTSNDLINATKMGYAENCLQRGSYGKFQVYNRNKPFEPLTNELNNTNYIGNIEYEYFENSLKNKYISNQQIILIILLILIIFIIFYCCRYKN